MNNEAEIEKLVEQVSSHGKLVILPVGLPGSGKSTFVETISSTVGYRIAVHSTDDFLIGEDGVYRFDQNLMHKYHQKNLEAFEISLKRRVPVVIVDNTNLKSQYRKPYVRLAEKYGYPVQMIVIGEFSEEAIKEYAKRNRHKVPYETILAMAETASIPKNCM